MPDLLWLMDCFVLTSHFEGLGLAFVEAQAAGLPCVISTGLPITADEQRFPMVDVAQLPLSGGAATWAEAVAQALARGRHDPPRMNFDVAETTRELVNFYAAACRAAGRGSP